MIVITLGIFLIYLSLFSLVIFNAKFYYDFGLDNINYFIGFSYFMYLLEPL